MTDEPRTLALIRKHLPDQAEALIVTRESLDKKAAAKLTAPQLAKVGLSLTGTEDTIVLKPTDGALDKFLAKILDETRDLEDAS